MGLFLRKNQKSSFKTLRFSVSSKLDCSSCIISIGKTVFKKIGALICSMKFLSPDIALYLYKSTILPCMKHCCNTWAGAPSFYLEMLDKLQKQLYRPVGPSLGASPEPLVHHQNVASLGLSYTFVNVHLTCLNWFY